MLSLINNRHIDSLPTHTPVAEEFLWSFICWNITIVTLILMKNLNDLRNGSPELYFSSLNCKYPGETRRQSDFSLTQPDSHYLVADEDPFNGESKSSVQLLDHECTGAQSRQFKVLPGTPDPPSLAAGSTRCNLDESDSALLPTPPNSPTIATDTSLCDTEHNRSLGLKPPRAIRKRSKVVRVAAPPRLSAQSSLSPYALTVSRRRIASGFSRFGDLPQELQNMVLEFSLLNSETPTVTIGAGIVQSTTSDGTIARTSLSIPRLPPIFYVSRAAREAAMFVGKLLERLHPVNSPWLDLAGRLHYYPPTQVLEINVDTVVMTMTPLVMGEIFYWLRALPMMKKIQRLHIRSACPMLPQWHVAKNIAEELDFEFPSLTELSFSRHPYDKIRKDGWKRPTCICPSIDHLFPAFYSCGPESQRLFIFLVEWLLTQTAAFYRNSWRGRAGFVTTLQPGHTFPVSSLVAMIGREARFLTEDSFVLYPKKTRELVVPAGEEVFLDRMSENNKRRSLKFRVVDVEGHSEQDGERREPVERRLICQ